jgi:nonsense-mediated mRNA decay protein 3
LESRELLTLLIKKLKGSIGDARLTDASFIWTEPHSKRVKIKLTVQKEIQPGAVIEQTVPIEFVVQG